MAFVIDSEDWSFEGYSNEQIIIEVEGFLAALENIESRDERVWLGNDFQSKLVLGDFTIWDLFSPEAGLGLSRDVCQELAAVINTASYYEDDEQGWPQGFADLNAVVIDAAVSSLNLDVLWAFCLQKSRRACGLIGLTRRGVRVVECQGERRNLHWVRTHQDRVDFWRDAIVVQGDSFEMLQQLSANAYPNLYFPASLWRAGDQLEGGYHSQSALLRRYFQVFDDYGAWAFTASPPDENYREHSSSGNGDPSSQLIIRRFIRLGLDVVPEKPNVAQDIDCKKARTIEVDGLSLYCHWHGRLQAWTNRVHIHAPVAKTGGKMVVAIVKDHLPLPGQ